ncbi:hypothetical protein CHUAL_001442 [Chamberlinius hualienensis]
MNVLAAELEKKRETHCIIVHVDMDAYYAAVEMRDDPKLVNLPMAVGGLGMLSTSNYIARKYGIRAAMPGFIAKKLCPNLIIVKPNFEKYTRVSEQVRGVIALYDSNYSAVSLDEAYLEITALVDVEFAKDSERSREEIGAAIVDEMRQKIFQETKLTCSAGIAVNARLAKVCSNINKPNGQFCIPFTREDVMNFVSTLPVGKICGVGNVSQQMLHALGVNVCQDLWEKRAEISIVFSPLSAESYLSISLGMGSTRIYNDEGRKSISVERTFRDTSDVNILRNKCEKLSDHLCDDLKAEGILGKVVTLKVKTSCYHTRTRAKTLAFYTDNEVHVKAAAMKLLEQEIKSVCPENLVLRLMGVRMSTLIDKSIVPKKQQKTLENVLKNIPTVDSFSYNNDATSDCGVSREDDDHGFLETIASLGSFSNWVCPVCLKVFSGDDSVVQNQHIDHCLSKQKIKEVLKNDATVTTKEAAKREATSSPMTNQCRKRTKLGVKTIKDYFKKF